MNYLSYLGMTCKNNRYLHL